LHENTKSNASLNPTTKQHAIVSIKLNMCHVSREIHTSIVAQFVPTSVVIVTLPGHVCDATNSQKDSNSVESQIMEQPVT